MLGYYTWSLKYFNFKTIIIRYIFSLKKRSLTHEKHVGYAFSFNFYNFNRFGCNHKQHSSKGKEKKRKEKKRKDKKAALKSKRDAQIAPIDNQIKTKKQQIKDVKKSATMTETEKNIRVRSYERQIEALEAKKERINKTYQTGIDAIK